MAERFGPVWEGDTLVFGSQRPGYGSTDVPNSKVEQWLNYMENNGIKRVVCLLGTTQLDYYDDLLESYSERFGLSTTVGDGPKTAAAFFYSIKGRCQFINPAQFDGLFFVDGYFFPWRLWCLSKSLH